MPISTSYNPSAPTTSSTTGSNKGNREDLSNELALLAPEETPVMSLCPKSKASGVLHEWVIDGLDDPSTSGVLETADVTSFTDKFANRGRLGNYIQKERRDYLVSDIQNAVDSAVAANVAAAEVKSMKELKRDFEAAICSNNDRQADTGSVPYKLRGLGDWLDSAGPSDVPASYRTPSGSILAAAVTETTLNGQLGSIYEKTGNLGSLTLVANIALRKVIAGFARSEGTTTATAYNINENASSKKITLSVSLFDSDFGIVRVVNANPKCMPAAATYEGYTLDPKFLSFATLIPMGNTRLENQGAGQRGYVDMVGTLCVKHPQAHGKIAYS
jgi:hypothetical protein